MLYTITILTALLVAAIYPLCFWISANDPLKNGFHKFHIGLPLVLAGTLCTYLLLHDFPFSVRATAAGWLLVFSMLSLFYWNKPFCDHRIMTLPVLLGVVCYIFLQNHLIGYSAPKVFVGLLSGLIFCATLFAMNLGHWYLNVHGLPVAHLIRMTKILASLFAVRLCWDAFALLSMSTFHQGVALRLFEYLLTLDGFLMSVGIFFGTLFPFVSLYFVLGVLKLKNTQAATGILYVTLVSVLLGDMAYKYYLIKFGIVL